MIQIGRNLIELRPEVSRPQPEPFVGINVVGPVRIQRERELRQKRDCRHRRNRAIPLLFVEQSSILAVPGCVQLWLILSLRYPVHG